jgi:hypothetical protein
MIIPASISAHHTELSAKLKESYESWHVIDECLKTFSIVSKTARAQLSHYFLLYWEPSHLLEVLDGDDKSYITRDGIRYYVIYTEFVVPENLGQYEQIKLSFRKPQGLSFGFALVRSVRTTISKESA